MQDWDTCIFEGPLLCPSQSALWLPKVSITAAAQTPGLIVPITESGRDGATLGGAWTWGVMGAAGLGRRGPRVADA